MNLTRLQGIKADIWCLNADRQRTKSTLNWSIKEISQWRTLETGQFIKSPYFDHRIVLYLILYPNGRDEANSENFCIDFYCKHDVDLYMQCCLAIFDSSEKCKLVWSQEKYWMSDTKKKEGWTLKKQDIFNNPDLIKDDELSISCSIVERNAVNSTSGVALFQNKIFLTEDCFEEAHALLLSDLKVMFDSKMFTDIVLIVLDSCSEPKEFAAHRNVLAARSSFFANLFQSHPLQSTFEIDHIKPITLDAVLQYVYTNSYENNISQETVNELYVAATLYNLKELKLACSKFLRNSLTLENALELLKFANERDDISLKFSIIHFIYTNDKCIVRGSAWKEFLREERDLAVNILQYFSAFELGNFQKPGINTLENHHHYECKPIKRSFTWSFEVFKSYSSSEVILKTPRFRLSSDNICANIWISFHIDCNDDIHFSVHLKNIGSKAHCFIVKKVQKIIFEVSILDVNKACKLTQSVIAQNVDDKIVTKHTVKHDDLSLLPNGTLTLYSVITLYVTQEILCVNNKSLKNAFKEQYISDMRSLNEDTQFSDVTFVCEGKELKANKNFLVSRSPVFMAMFQSTMTETLNNIINITDLDTETLKCMLRYIHTGVLENLEDTAMSLYKAGDKYDVHGLKQICSNFLRSKVFPENVLEILVLADMHHDQKLKQSAMKFIEIHSKAIMRDATWETFLKENVYLALEILELPSLYYISENGVPIPV